jgi:hypothetical protein
VPRPAPPPLPNAVAAPAQHTTSIFTSQPPPRAVTVRFPARIVHPAPLDNPGAAHLDVRALRVRLKPNRKCGPREVAGGHWIHLDCNVHAPLTQAKAFSPRKVKLLLAGALKLDDPVGGGALPDGIDHRNDGTEGPVKDQGQVGACTAFSLSSAMDNAIRRQNKSDTTSSLHLWSHYGYSAMRNAGDGNVKKPIATWETWPYDERVACELDQSGDDDCGPYSPPIVPGSSKGDAQVQAKIKAADAAGAWQVTEYDSIANDPDTIASVLATGADVWFSMDIGESWMSPNGDTVADWNQFSIDGGHAILFAGYRHKNGQRQFLVHNSWGKGWGDGGYAYISENMVRQYIKNAYKVVVSAKGGPPPPPPSDPSALTDDDCGEDQLVDSVTGQCAQICPDDSRPANGQCDVATGAKKPRGH